MKLANYCNQNFHRGRSKVIELIWIIFQALFITSFIPGSIHRRILLRWFGATIGQGVIIKPGLKVKFPWRLNIGNHSWIGEKVWIDNLVTVKIGDNCCISQEAYLCTGSHNWSATSFDLITKPITIQDYAWICARSNIGPGVIIGEGAVLTMGSTSGKNLESWQIYRGNPAVSIGQRNIPGETANASPYIVSKAS